MAEILCTGALGVIGSRLTGLLRARGHTVMGADLAIREYSDYIRADVTAFEDLHRIGQRHRVDVVIHMAGEVGRMVGETHPQRMVHVNEVGTLNVIQFCLEQGARLVYFSTSEVYGHLLDSGEPVKESIIAERGNPFITTNVYAMSKLFGEALIKHYCDNYGLKAIAVRPFMVYGPGEAPSSWRSAITRFVHAARHGQPVVVHRGAKRAWCYVNDFAEAVGILAERTEAQGYEVYNVGSDEYLSMEEVAQAIVQAAQADEDLITVVEPPDRFMSLVKRADLTQIFELGYRPRVSLAEGVGHVVAWQEKQGF